MKVNNGITQKELDSIRFYMGDPEIVTRGDFRGGPKAYNTINALLHEGTGNELDKMKEGKKIELLDADHLKSYLSISLDILSAMEKYRTTHDNNRLTTYRIERFSAIEQIREKGYIQGFYSTCKWGFLKEYAATKADIILMEIVRETDMPYLDFEELFGDYYAKKEEAEILLPVGAAVKGIENIEMTQEEKETYLDVNGNPPVGKYRIVLGRKQEENKETADKESLYNEITFEEVVTKVQKCLEKLKVDRELEEEYLTFYCDWKNKIAEYVWR